VVNVIFPNCILLASARIGKPKSVRQTDATTGNFTGAKYAFCSNNGKGLYTLDEMCGAFTARKDNLYSPIDDDLSTDLYLLAYVSTSSVLYLHRVGTRNAYRQTRLPDGR